MHYIAGACGSEGQTAPLKSFLRVSEKMILDYGSEPAKVTDLLRGKIIVGSVTVLAQALSLLCDLDPALQGVFTEPFSQQSPRGDIPGNITILQAKNRLGG